MGQIIKIIEFFKDIKIGDDVVFYPRKNIFFDKIKNLTEIDFDLLNFIDDDYFEEFNFDYDGVVGALGKVLFIDYERELLFVEVNIDQTSITFFIHGSWIKAYFKG